MNNKKLNCPLVSYKIRVRELKALCKTKKFLFIPFTKNQKSILWKLKNNSCLIKLHLEDKTNLEVVETLNIFFQKRIKPWHFSQEILTKPFRYYQGSNCESSSKT